MPGEGSHKLLLQRQSHDEVAKLLRDSTARKSLLGSHRAWL